MPDKSVNSGRMKETLTDEAYTKFSKKTATEQQFYEIVSERFDLLYKSLKSVCPKLID